MALMQPPDSPWGATFTTTIQTLLTATSNQASITINYPWPAKTAPIAYTTITRTANVLPKVPPNIFMTNKAPTMETFVMPILVLTNVEAVIVNMRGETINRATLMQPQPSRVRGLGDPEPTMFAVPVSGEARKCGGFECWSTGQKVGTLVAVVVVGGGILFLIFSILRRCFGAKKKKGENDSGSSTDVERGGDGGNGGAGGSMAPVPLNPLQPIALVPDVDLDDDDKLRKKGALFLWRKKGLVKKARLSSSSSTAAVYNSLAPSQPAVFVASPFIPTIITPGGSVALALPRQRLSTGEDQVTPVRTRDFAYNITEGMVNTLDRLPPVPTVDAEPNEKRRQRQERRDRRARNSAVMDNVEAAVKEKRKKEQKEYDRGHRNRGRRERSRSQMSENYEKRGDRLRKESPEAKAEDRAERKEAERHRNKLRAQRSSRGHRRSEDRHQSDNMYRQSRDMDQEPRGRAKSSSTRGRSSSPDVRVGGHRQSMSLSQSRDSRYKRRSSIDNDGEVDSSRRDSRTEESTRRKSGTSRYYPPISHDRGVKHDISHLQVGLEKHERQSVDSKVERAKPDYRPRAYSPNNRSRESRSHVRPNSDTYFGSSDDQFRDGRVDVDKKCDRGRLRPSSRDKQQPRQERSPRRHRSISPHRHLSKKKTGKERSAAPNKPSKLMTLLPIALAAIDALAEPSGGWEQYHRKDEDTRTFRSNSVDTGLEGRRRQRHSRRSRDLNNDRLRGSSLDRGATRFQENMPRERLVDGDLMTSKDLVARSSWDPSADSNKRLSRKHVKIVRRERSSDATVVRGGGEQAEDDTETRKRARFSDHSPVKIDF